MQEKPTVAKRRKRNAHVNAEEFRLAIETIIRARQFRSVTQRELASLCGMNQGDISKIENGHGNPSLKTMQRLAQALSCRLVIDFVPKEQLRTPPRPITQRFDHE